MFFFFSLSSHLWAFLSYCIGRVNTIDLKCYLPTLEPTFTFQFFSQVPTFSDIGHITAMCPDSLLYFKLFFLQDCIVIECFVVLLWEAHAGWCFTRRPAVSSVASVSLLLLSLAEPWGLLSLFYKWVNCGSGRKNTLDTMKGCPV